MQAPRTRRLRNWLAAIAGVLLVAAFTGYLAISWWIGAGVKAQVASARSRYAGDPVEALIALAADEGRSLSDRNHAVWALGQLGDSRALPLLGRLQTGQPCDHARRVCEHELAKAIKGAEGGLNATAWVWGRGAFVGGAN